MTTLGAGPTAGGVPPWTPASVAGYQGLWSGTDRYSDAAGTVPQTTTGGNVRAWRDRLDPTGGAMLTRASGIPPTLTAAGDLLFGSGGFLNFPAGLWASCKTLILFMDSNGGSGFRQIAGVEDSGGGVLWLWNGGSILWNATAGGYSTRVSDAGNGVQPYAVVMSAVDDRLYWHGREPDSYIVQGASGGLARTDPSGVGGTGTFPNDTLKVTAAAAFSEELSAADILRVMQWMHADLTPADARPLVWMMGNSLTEGTAVPVEAERYVERLAAALPGADFLNFGVGGAQTPDVTAMIYPQMQLDGNWDARRLAYVSMLEITNNLNVGGVSAATAWSNVQAFHATAGLYLFAGQVACTCPHNVVVDADRLSVNASIRAGYEAAGCAAIIDFGAMTHIGTSHEVGYWADALHPNGTGCGVMANGDGTIPGAITVIGEVIS